MCPAPLPSVRRARSRIPRASWSGAAPGAHPEVVPGSAQAARKTVRSLSELAARASGRRASGITTPPQSPARRTQNHPEQRRVATEVFTRRAKTPPRSLRPTRNALAGLPFTSEVVSSLEPIYPRHDSKLPISIDPWFRPASANMGVRRQSGTVATIGVFPGDDATRPDRQSLDDSQFCEYTVHRCRNRE